MIERVRELLAGRKSNRRARDLVERAPGPIRPYLLEARIEDRHAGLAALDLERISIDLVSIDFWPPKAPGSPEISITWAMYASSRVHAERHGRRRLEDRGITVYAIKALRR